MHRTEKAGLGAAYLHGFAVALERGYDVIGEMDADGSHQPEQLHRLVEALERRRPRHRLALGAGRQRRQLEPRSARRCRSAATSTPGSLLGIPVHDVTAGFRLFRRRARCARIDLATVESVGYCFQTDLTAAHPPTPGCAVREVPIEFLERERGESKMNRAVATESLRRITRWGLEARRLRSRRSVAGTLRPR